VYKVTVTKEGFQGGVLDARINLGEPTYLEDMKLLTKAAAQAAAGGNDKGRAHRRTRCRCRRASPMKYLHEPHQRTERGHRRGAQAAGAQTQEGSPTARPPSGTASPGRRAGRLGRGASPGAAEQVPAPPPSTRRSAPASARLGREPASQEAEVKAAALADLGAQGLRWHLVGHLQSNKARKAAGLFDWVHSVDGAPIGLRLDEAAAAAGRELRALVQVELVPEATKSGLDESQLFPALESLRGLAAVKLVGLMALPPYDDDAERTRPHWRSAPCCARAGLPRAPNSPWE
jgi:hypothetical protein